MLLYCLKHTIILLRLEWSALKMGAARSFCMLVCPCQTALYHKPEDHTVNFSYCKIPKSRYSRICNYNKDIHLLIKIKSMYLLQEPDTTTYSLQVYCGNKLCFKWKPNPVIFKLIQFSHKEHLLVNMEYNLSTWTFLLNS